MDRSDDDREEVDSQRNKLEGKVPDGDDTTESHQASSVVLPGIGWAPRRSRLPSLKSNLSVIAASAKLIIFIGLVAILYFGRPVFVPLAVAILLAFILAPLVRALHRWHLGRIPSILTVVIIAFVIIFGLGMILAEQVTHLAAALPQYQATLTKKIDELRGMTAGRGTLGQASDVLRNLNRELKNEPGAIAEQHTIPVPVEVLPPVPGPLEVIQKIINPLLDPLMTTGIIIVFVIFFLVQREDLRDRLIRLAGSTDLHRTTIAIDDAGHRLSRYLLTQTALNAAFGVIIGGGLALIGVPKPLLYGHSTGISPVAVVVAAMFWTWLWGPIGLLLSTPLTVCLDVLGRHVDRLRFLDILLGSKPALNPPECLYHLILSGNSDEAFEQAESMLKTKSLSSFYDEVAIEGLRLAAIDAHRGVLDLNGLQRIRAAVGGLVADLSHFEDVMPPAGITKAVADATKPTPSPSTELPMVRRDQLHGAWVSATAVLCIPGPGPLDEAAAAILAQILEKHGLGVRVEKHQVVSPENIFHLGGDGVALVCLSYIDVGDAPVRARAAIRRVQRQIPNATVLVGLWGPNKDQSGAIRSELKANYYANSFSEAARLCIKAAQRPRFWVAS
jgi:predicted PurR-regulated permease PerM